MTSGMCDQHASDSSKLLVTPAAPRSARGHVIAHAAAGPDPPKSRRLTERLDAQDSTMNQTLELVQQLQVLVEVVREYRAHPGAQSKVLRNDGCACCELRHHDSCNEIASG